MSVLIILVSIVLIAIVLIQPGKGDMASTFGGFGQFSSVLGTRRAADFLTKATISLAAAIMVLSLITNYFFVGQVSSDLRRPVTEGKNLSGQSPSSPIQNQQPAPQQGQQRQPAPQSPQPQQGQQQQD